MSTLRPSAAWRARLAAQGDQPPARPRLPLRWQGIEIGSVEPQLFDLAGLREGGFVSLATGPGGAALAVEGELSRSLAAIALALRDRGLADAWRDEPLGVRDASGRLLGEVERAAVRPLGIATESVYLAALDEHGRHWVQERALDKPNDPGLWDTLVGGMVPARDAIPEALARETWEEAGLRLEQLGELRPGGCILTRRPSAVPRGYVVERLHWFRCIVPEGVVPENQDGEVASFARLDAEEVTRRLERDAFTVDAALILLQAFGGPPG